MTLGVAVEGEAGNDGLFLSNKIGENRIGDGK